jgi:cation diffusion facilitator CzcD-associated flavoprotein CzcO
MQSMKSVAIIGTGITGVIAVFYLKRKTVPVAIYETGGRVGGIPKRLKNAG